MQIFLNLLAILAIYLAIWPKAISAKAISAILGAFWLWMGFVYHWRFFSEINKAAYVFGIIFILQGILFLYKGVYQNALHFSYTSNVAGRTGAVLVVYALFIYPALGYILGHRYPAAPTFGLPCPTTIFTLGILLWMRKKPAFYLLAIPLLWSLIGFTAALKLGVREDVGLLIAGVLSGWVVFRWDRVGRNF